MISLICGILTTDWYKWTYLQNRNETYRHRKQTYSYQSVRWGRSKLGVGINIYTLLLLLLLSRFSRVWLCDPIDGSPLAPPSLGFSRQAHWSGLPFPSPVHESEKWKWSRSVVSNPQRPHGLQPSRLLCLWDFPGKSTGVGCHYLLQYTHYYT